ncbi:MAG TPA: phosphoesterase [Corynebacterium sp.]|nr:phosphoesterase [Corynebacterium sp.]
MTLAKLITEVCAPWVSNITLFLILGVGFDALGPGLLASTMTGVLPMVAIMAMIRRGKVDNHHVTAGHQRAAVFAVILGLLAILIAGLLMMDTPREIWLAVTAALLFIAIFAVVTRFGLKISIHVGHWLAVWIYLGIVLSPWWWLALLMTPVIAWSRLKLTHHSWPEITGGTLAGLAVVGIMLPLV